MSHCLKPELQKLLHSYELGLLDDPTQKELELHLMDCEACFNELKSFQNETELIREDSEIINHVKDLAGSKEIKKKSFINIKTLAWPLVSAAAIILLVFSSWQIDIKPTDEVVAKEDKLLISDFKNLDDSLAVNSYGQMISNLLIADLSQAKLMNIVSDQRHYDINRILTKDSVQPSALEKASYANARWLLSGAYMIVDSTIMLNAQLIDVYNGNIVKAFVIESELEEPVFSLVERFSNEIKAYLSNDENKFAVSSENLMEITSSSEDAYQAYLAGVDNFRKFYYQDALADFEKALSYDSTYAMPYYYLSRLKSRSFIYQAVAYSSGINYSDSVYIVSRRMTIEGQTDSAMIVLNDLIEKYPDEKEAYYQLGLYHYRLASFDSAIYNLNQSVALDPFLKQTYNVLAYCYMMKNDYDNTIISIDKYIELAKGEANPFDTKGTLHAAFGQLDNAIEAYQQALEIKSDFYSSLSMLSYMYLYKSEFQKFDSCNNILLESNSKIMVPAARLYEPYLPVRQGKLNSALKLIDNNIKTDIKAQSDIMGMAHKQILKASIFEGLGLIDSALAVINLYDSLHSQHAPRDKFGYKYYEIYLQVKSGVVEKARELFESIPDDYEDHPNGYFTYWFGRGMLEYNSRNFEQAAKYFEQSVSRSLERNAFGNYVGQYMTALSLYKDNKLAQAAEKFEEMKTIYTSRRLFWSVWDIKLPYHLGIIYEESNWHDKAIEEYRAYMKYMEQVDFDSQELADAKSRLERLEKNL